MHIQQQIIYLFIKNTKIISVSLQPALRTPLTQLNLITILSPYLTRGTTSGFPEMWDCSFNSTHSDQAVSGGEAESQNALTFIG